MSEPAIGRMTLAEFLRWDDGTDTRWELVDGVPVAMAPPAVAHGILAARLAGLNRCCAALAPAVCRPVGSRCGAIRP
jgi:Uma2 family endonuclease